MEMKRDKSPERGEDWANSLYFYRDMCHVSREFIDKKLFAH